MNASGWDLEAKLVAWYKWEIMGKQGTKPSYPVIPAYESNPQAIRARCYELAQDQILREAERLQARQANHASRLEALRDAQEGY